MELVGDLGSGVLGVECLREGVSWCVDRFSLVKAWALSEDDGVDVECVLVLEEE